MRNEYDEKINSEFVQLIKEIHEDPKIASLLPNWISKDTDAYIVHKLFRGKEYSYSDRVKLVINDFDKTLESLARR